MCVLCVCVSYVLLEHKAAEQSGGLFGRQVVEEAVKHHLSQEELISAREKTHTVRFPRLQPPVRPVPPEAVGPRGPS